MRTLDRSAAGRKPIPPRATLVGSSTVRVFRSAQPDTQTRRLYGGERFRCATCGGNGVVEELEPFADRSDHRPRMRPTTPWEAAQALGTSRRLASRGVPAPRRGEPPGPGLTLCLRAVVALWATPLLVVLSSCFVPPATPEPPRQRASHYSRRSRQE